VTGEMTESYNCVQQRIRYMVSQGVQAGHGIVSAEGERGKWPEGFVRLVGAQRYAPEVVHPNLPQGRFRPYVGVQRNGGVVIVYHFCALARREESGEVGIGVTNLPAFPPSVNYPSSPRRCPHRASELTSAEAV